MIKHDYKAQARYEKRSALFWSLLCKGGPAGNDVRCSSLHLDPLMYISINMDTLRFLHKHENVNLLCNLDFIEAPHDTVDVCPIDCATFLSDATETEMQGLYRNTTGEECSVYHGPQLREVLRALAELLPVSDANPFEADRQAAYIEKQEPKGMKGYVYVKGANIPGKPAELFPLGLRATITSDAAAIAARKRPTAVPAPASTPAGTPAAPPRTPRTPRCKRPTFGRCARNNLEGCGLCVGRSWQAYRQTKRPDAEKEDDGCAGETTSNQTYIVIKRIGKLAKGAGVKLGLQTKSRPVTVASRRPAVGPSLSTEWRKIMNDKNRTNGS